MVKTVGKAALVFTFIVDVVAICCFYFLFVLHTDFGEFSGISAGSLVILVILVAIIMTLGCYEAYMGVTQEDLERMVPKER